MPTVVRPDPGLHKLCWMRLSSSSSLHPVPPSCSHHPTAPGISPLIPPGQDPTSLPALGPRMFAEVAGAKGQQDRQSEGDLGQWPLTCSAVVCVRPARGWELPLEEGALAGVLKNNPLACQGYKQGENKLPSELIKPLGVAVHAALSRMAGTSRSLSH